MSGHKDISSHFGMVDVINSVETIWISGSHPTPATIGSPIGYIRFSLLPTYLCLFWLTFHAFVLLCYADAKNVTIASGD